MKSPVGISWRTALYRRLAGDRQPSAPPLASAVPASITRLIAERDLQTAEIDPPISMRKENHVPIPTIDSP